MNTIQFVKKIRDVLDAFEEDRNIAIAKFTKIEKEFKKNKELKDNNDALDLYLTTKHFLNEEETTLKEVISSINKITLKKD